MLKNIVFRHSTCVLNKVVPCQQLNHLLIYKQKQDVFRFYTQGKQDRSKSSQWKWKKFNTESIILLSVPVLTFCLGCWQVQRKQWKLNLIEDLRMKMAMDPVPLSPSDGDNEYKKVLVTGKFDHSHEMLLGPRSQLMLNGGKNSNSLVSTTGHNGFLVVTPFKLADQDITILVSRGWVPNKKKDPASRMEGQVTGNVTFTGIIRKGESTPFVPTNSTGISKPFLCRDVKKMAAVANTSEIYIDAVETFINGPVGGQTNVAIRNEHLAYIITWYTLSVITFYMWYSRFIIRN